MSHWLSKDLALSFLIKKFKNRTLGFHAYIVHGTYAPLCQVIKEDLLPSSGKYERGLLERYRKHSEYYSTQGMCYECRLGLARLPL